MDTHIHLMGVKRTIGCELKHGFLEIEIASVTDGGRDPVPFLVEHSGGELLALLNLASLFVLRDRADVIHRDIDLVMTYFIGLISSNEVC